MRITEGQFRGRNIQYKEKRGTRVTSEKTRKAVFDVLKNITYIDDSKVCDLFAGSGMYGFESISRGAGEVIFVDMSRVCTKMIGENLEKLDIENFRIVNKSYDLFIKNTEDKFDIVFADPPYFDFDFDKFNEIHKILEEEGIFVLEYSSKTEIQDFDYLEKIIEKKYGDTKVAIFRKSK